MSIREGCRLGARVVVQDGAVIGADGFGFAHRADGTHEKIPQVGPVVIEDDVEIGANTTIDRPAVGETRIRAGAKIDNLVQIAHGVSIGLNTLLASQVGIAGSTTIGDNVILAGQVGVGEPPHHRRRREGHRPDRHQQLDRGRPVRVGAAGHRQPRVGEGGGARSPGCPSTAASSSTSNAAWPRSKRRPGPPPPRDIIEHPVHDLSHTRRLVHRRRALGWALAGLALALAATWTPLSAAVAPPKLQYQRFTLPNGLTVILHEDRSTPIAHVQIWYHVGSKNERTGRTGFAHLFEHMMFKGSKNVEPEQHTSIVSSVGGRANAYTNEDATVYWNTVPSQYLPLVLWMEADRLGSLTHRRADLRQRARGGEGRAADARRQPAVRQPQRAALPERLHRRIPTRTR